MLYDRELIVHKLARWENFISNYSLPAWDAIPDFGLYMEQVVTFLSDSLSFVPVPEEPKDRLITAAAINNYVRLKLMPAPVKKRYYRIHIAYLIMIFTLKQSLSIQDVQRAVPMNMSEDEMRAFYQDYVAKFHSVALLFVDLAREATRNVLSPESNDDSAIPNMVMLGALVSGFSRILVEKILRLQGADTQAVLEKENRGKK